MSHNQNYSKDSEITVVPVPYEMLTEVQRTYIDWKALGGLITDDNGVRKITLDELGEMCGVQRTAFQKAKEAVPNFWDLVQDRRTLLNGQGRLAAMHDAWYLHARTMKNWALSEAWFRNYDPNYKEAKTKTEIGIGSSILDALENARSVNSAAVIEGEVVDEQPPTN